MSDMKKSVLTSVRIIAGAAAILLGFQARQRVDLGAIVASNSNVPFSGLVASQSNDVNVPAGDYFYELSQKLKEEYVEPVTDDQKLASGAIRGMIASLDDPDSIFMSKDEFAAYLNARIGKYEGIGADLELVRNGKSGSSDSGSSEADSDMTPEDAMVTVKEIPHLQVMSVVPGGPADKAGVKVGDVVRYVDDHWVVDSGLINKFRIALRKVNNKQMPATELNAMRAEIRSKSEHALLPARAKDKLFLGKSGTVNVVWSRNGKEITTKIERSTCEMPGFSVDGDRILLPMVEGDGGRLANAVKGKSEVTIDLRNSTLGNPQVMRDCLSAVAKPGNYGYFTTKRHDSPTPLEISVGNAHPPKIQLIVDKSTRGPAEVFALALASKGLVRVSDSEMGGDVESQQIVKLPDGSGYTLATSAYQATVSRKALNGAKGTVALQEVRK